VEAHVPVSQQPKILGGPTISTLSDQKHVVCDTASQSTKRHDMLEICEGPWPLCPPDCAYDMHSGH